MDNIQIISGRSHVKLVNDICDYLNVEATPTQIYDFANGEIYVRYGRSMRGKDVFLIQSHCEPINHRIMEQLIMVDALKRSSAKRITAIMPFYGYSRQDKKHLGREPISAKLLADMFYTAGTNRIISVDLHSDQIQGFFAGPVDHLTSLPVMVDYIKRNFNVSNLAIVAPDAGRVKFVSRYAELINAPLSIVHKKRNFDKPNCTEAYELVGSVENKSILIVDDIIDTGSTIINAIKLMFERGAVDVSIIATHAILSNNALDKILRAGAKRIIVTDSLPQNNANLEVVSIAKLLARAIEETYIEGSITKLLEI